MSIRPSGGASTGGTGTSSAVGTTLTPTGNVSATNVQAAIAELDSEKLGALAYRGIWAGSTVYALGDVVYWLAQQWITTTAHTSGSDFDSTKFAPLGRLDQGAFVGLNVACYGHSWVGFWYPRLISALAVGTSYNGGAGGSIMANAAQAIAKTPTTGPNVYVVGCSVNDAAGNSAAAQASFSDGLRAWLDFAHAPAATTSSASAGRLLNNSGFSYFTFTGTWSTTADTNCASGQKKSTTTQNDSFKLEFFGDRVSIMLMAPASGSGAAYSVALPGGAVLATGTIATSPTIYQPVRLAGFGLGWHTITVTKTDATGSTLTVDCATVPVTYPPTAVVVKDPPVADSVHPYISIYSGLVDTVLAETYTASNAPANSILSVDVAGGTSWSTTNDIDTGGFHPSDRGTNKYWKRIFTALASLGYRAGQNIVSGADAAAAVPASVAAGSDNFTRTNNPASLGVTSTGAVPWQVLSKSAVFGINTNKAIVTASNGAQIVAAVELGKTDTTITTVLNPASLGGMFVRGTAVGNGYVWWSNGTFNTLTNGSLSSLTPTSGSATGFTDNDVISIVMSGSTFTLKVNGTTTATYTNSTYAGTLHGLAAVAGFTTMKWTSFAWT